MPFSTDKSIDVVQQLGALEVQDEGVLQNANTRALNFVGASVVASDTNGVTTVTLSGGDAIIFGAKYTFSSSTSSSPSSGELRLNNADPTLATEIYVNNTDRNSASASGLLNFLELNSVIGVLDESDSTSYHFYNLTNQVDNGPDRTYTVSYLYGNGTILGNVTFAASVRGPQGLQGSVGNDGADGVSGFGTRHTFSSTTTAPPQAGEIRANNATLGSVTELYISETDRNSTVVDYRLRPDNRWFYDYVNR